MKDIKKINNFFDKHGKNISYITLIIWCLLPIMCSIFRVFFDPVYIIYIFDLLIGLLGLIYLFFKTVQCKKITLIYKLFIIFYIWLFICSLLSSNKLISFFGNNNLHAGFLTILSFLSFMFLSKQIDDEKRYINLFKIIIVSTFITCIIDKTINPYFMQSYFNNPNHYGYYLLIGIVTNIMILLKNINLKEKLFFILTLLIILYTLIYNNTFGCYIALLITLIFLTIYRIIVKKKVPIIILLIFIIMSLLVNDGKIVKENFNGLGNDIGKIVNNENIDKIGTNRGSLWQKGFELVLNKPITGYGPNNYSKAYRSVKQYENENPHNIFLFISLAAGFPSLIIIMIILINTYLNKLKKYKDINEIEEICLFVTIAFIISSMFGNISMYVSPFFYIFFGLLIKFWRDEKNEKNC